MTYVIHGARGSGSCIIEAACAEIGVDYEIRDLDVRAGEQRGDNYAVLNPLHKIPTLELDDGEVITESAAILITLDERHRDAGLLPPYGSKQRAQALRWMLFMVAELYPIVEIMDFPERFSGSASDNQAIHERANQIWQQRWLVVERNLVGSPYCLDSGFSAADLYIALLSRWDMQPDWRREHLPRVDALTAAVRARPALAAVWARHAPRPTPA